MPVTVKGYLLVIHTIKYPVAAKLAGQYPHYIPVTVKGTLLETHTMKYPVVAELAGSIHTIYQSL